MRGVIRWWLPSYALLKPKRTFEFKQRHRCTRRQSGSITANSTTMAGIALFAHAAEVKLTPPPLPLRR